MTEALSIVAAADEGGDRPAVLTSERAWTFAELAERTRLRARPRARARARARLRSTCATPAFEALIDIYAALEDRMPIAILREESGDIDDVVDDDTAAVLFTSGSTAAPRGVVLSRAALLAAANASPISLRDDDRWLCCLSLAHAGGLAIAIRCLVARKPLLLADDAGAIANATIASLVPTQLARLLDDPAWRPPAQLRAVLLGGAAAPPALIDAALARGVPVLSTYGMTETFGQVATARVPGETPRLLPGVTITGGTRDAPGVLRIRGPMLATRYLDGTPIAPELVTSDVGFVDGDVVRVLGRADDVIITGGENVHPAQVEAVLAATPGVRAAAAFGVADDRWGQVIAAALVIDDTFNAAAARVRWHAALPPHARPRRLATVTELPQLASGKLDRRVLAKLASAPIDYA